MSKYTTELRYIIQQGYDLGMKNYPIFDENYRQTLNQKIIEHYYFREIGFETVELFKRFLNRTLNEIMPYYNQLYKSELIQFDPITSKKLVETYTRENTSDLTQNSDTTQNATTDGSGSQNTDSVGVNNSKNIFSDTPQGLLSMDNIDTNLYASNASIDGSEGKTTTSSTNTATSTTDSTTKLVADSNQKMSETFSKNFYGQDSDASALLKSFRETFLNIDMMVIDELNDLFMGLW